MCSIVYAFLGDLKHICSLRSMVSLTVFIRFEKHSLFSLILDSLCEQELVEGEKIFFISNHKFP